MTGRRMRGGRAAALALVACLAPATLWSHGAARPVTASQAAPADDAAPHVVHYDLRLQPNIETGTVAGEVTLVLDRQEVALKAGDIVVQRGTNHAWSNRSNKNAIVSVASHDGKYAR